ncbi:MAG: arsenate reductase (azurin) small subunit [Geminicoccaceae bacterium]
MSSDEPFCLGRRDVLGATASGVAFSVFLPAGADAADSQGTRVDLGIYPEKRIARLSELSEGEPIAFTYPLEEQPNMLVKLGEKALRGIGPDEDIIAYSSLCTHMGGSLRGRYRHDLKALGPCPFHFSVFDLKKGGIPVHASATQNLPQIVLKQDGDDIVAVGVLGLIYGFRNNLADGTLAEGAEPGSAKAPAIMRG